MKPELRPAELLDLQGDLMARLANTDSLLNAHMIHASAVAWSDILGSKVWNGMDVWVAEQAREGIAVYAPDEILSQIDEAAQDEVRYNDAFKSALDAQGAIVEVLKTSTAYHVSRDMTRLIIASSRSLNNEDKFDAKLVPSEEGFAWFEGGLPIIDVRGREELVHAILWATNGRGLVVWAWNDMQEPDDMTKIIMNDPTINLQAFMRDCGRWSFHRCYTFDDGDEMGPELEPVGFYRALRLSKDSVEAHDFTRIIRYFHSFFLMMNQKITAVETPTVDRPAVKRAKRRGTTLEVKLVRLRRTARPDYDTEDADSGHAPVEWSCSWVVDAHWAWRACGQGRKERRRVLIMPYVKGPIGAPLKLKKKVVTVHR